MVIQALNTSIIYNQKEKFQDKDELTLKNKWRNHFFSYSLPNIKKWKLDSKILLALENLDLYPIDIQLDKWELLAKVPGISIITAKNLILLRQKRQIDYIDISKCGGKLYLAKHFICLNGKLPPLYSIAKNNIKKENKKNQMYLFE